MSNDGTATMSLVDEIDYAIGGLRDDGGIELVARSGEELVAAVDDPDLAAQWLRELARLHDRRTEVVITPVDWPVMSNHAKLMHLALHCDNDVRAKIETIAEELRVSSMADAEMEAYRVEDISRETLVARLEELSQGDATILQWFRSHDRFGLAWHDDYAEVM